jgi:hypothetical protein
MTGAMDWMNEALVWMTETLVLLADCVTVMVGHWAPARHRPVLE